MNDQARFNAHNIRKIMPTELIRVSSISWNISLEELSHIVMVLWDGASTEVMSLSFISDFNL